MWFRDEFKMGISIEIHSKKKIRLLRGRVQSQLEALLWILQYLQAEAETFQGVTLRTSFLFQAI